jgi:hypothetical protein
VNVLVSPSGGNGNRLAVQPEEVVSDLLAGPATAGSVGTMNASTPTARMAGRARFAALRLRPALGQRTMNTVTFLRLPMGLELGPNLLKHPILVLKEQTPRIAEVTAGTNGLTLTQR